MMNMTYAGTHLDNGVPPNDTACVTGFDQVGFVMGTSASLFNVSLQCCPDNVLITDLMAYLQLPSKSLISPATNSADSTTTTLLVCSICWVGSLVKFEHAQTTLPTGLVYVVKFSAILQSLTVSSYTSLFTMSSQTRLWTLKRHGSN
jgi:hypothetical protein